MNFEDLCILRNIQGAKRLWTEMLAIAHCEERALSKSECSSWSSFLRARVMGLVTLLYYS
jgi:hypothetical protein